MNSRQQVLSFRRFQQCCAWDEKHIRQVDSLQQSIEGHAAAGFVPGLIRKCIIHLFVLGTKLGED